MIGNKTAMNRKNISPFDTLFRSTREMEQVEQMERVWTIIRKADMLLSALRLFFLFHLFRTFHGTERNKLPMVRADRYGRSAPVTGESGQSQFAPLKLRSLALVPSSGAQSAPSNSTYGSSTVRLCLPRPGLAGPDARDIRWKERPAGAKDSAIKRSAFGWFIPTRSLRSLPPNKGKAVARLLPSNPSWPPKGKTIARAPSFHAPPKVLIIHELT